MLTKLFKKLTPAQSSANRQLIRSLATTTAPSPIDELLPLKNRNRISRDVYSDLAIFLSFPQRCEDITRRLKDAEGYLDDHLIARAFQLLREENIEPDEHFFNGLIPLTTRYLRQFTRENSRAFTEIVRSAGALGVEDKDFWRAIKECLAINRLYRYIPLDDMGEVIKGFAIVGQADETVLQLLGDQVIKHKKFLD